MTPPLNTLLRLYAGLLRLYPPRFRAEFADEMQAVFAQALRDAGQSGAFDLIAVCLAETRDLPASLVREHLSERRQRSLMMEVVMSPAEMTLRVYRCCTTVLLSVVIAYGLFVVLPFYAFDLDSQPVNQVAGGRFDPKDFPFYASSPFGQIARLIGFCSVNPGLLCLSSLNIPLAWVLARSWKRFSRRQRRLGLLTIVVSLGALAFIFLPTGRVILSWFVD